MASSRLAGRYVLQNIAKRSVNAIHQSKPVIQLQKRSISLVCHAYQRYYTADHEWVDVSDNVGTVGITDHAQSLLGELVYVELPEVEAELEIGDVGGTVESVKAASDVMSPVTGVVTEINESLIEKPDTVNESPETDGWMFKIQLSDASEVEEMMNHEAYLKLIEESED